MKFAPSPAFWVGFVIILGLMGAALISPLYAIYAVEWQLPPSQITLIYAVYMAGALVSLLCVGRLPDQLGYRRMLFLALGLLSSGTALTMVAPDLHWLLPARFIVGFGSSIAITAGTRGLSELLSETLRPQLSLITSLLFATGFGIGPLFGGIAGQWLAYPLVTAHIAPLLGGMLGILALLLLVPKSGTGAISQRPGLSDIVPRMVLPPPGKRIDYLLACAAPFLSFGLFGLYAAIAPLFLEELLDLRGPLLSGAAITMLLTLSSLSQLMFRRVRVHQGAILSFGGIALGCAAMVWNLWLQSPAMFILSLLGSAIGHGMANLSCMSRVMRIATDENRAGLTATYLVIGYAGAILPVLVMGWIGDYWGLNAAVASYCSFAGVAASLLAAAIYVRQQMEGA